MSDEERGKFEKLLIHERWRRHFYFAIQYKRREYMNEVYKKHKKTGLTLYQTCSLYLVAGIGFEPTASRL